ncbi:MAG: hypothetical protein QNJ32_13925 [Xenococcaceae cyanobacterium MO_167.B27]|nr:hypothetical protein [Xenococcaceae cyanobacterium MO_167.B27]
MHVLNYTYRLKPSDPQEEIMNSWSCPECKYRVDRDIASPQELCNRGIEKVAQGLCGKETAYQIVDLSGAMSLDKWLGVGMPNSDVGKPTV